jgi:hypothetical protein
MAQNRKITKIIKVPIDKQIFKKNFIRQPQNYLELFENKEKIKHEFINKEYVPKLNENTVDKSPDIERSNDNDKSPDIERSNDNDKSPDIERSNDNDKSPDIERSNDNDKSPDIERSAVSSSNSDYSSSDTQSDGYSDDEISIKSSYKKNKKSNRDDKSLSKRMKELMRNEEDKDSYKKSKHKNRYTETEENVNIAPSLSNINGGNYAPRKVIENLDFTQENDEDLKRELLFKFELLKKSYKNSTIPDFNIHSDYKHMARSYEHTIRQVNIDSNVETYKGYLISGFYIVEYIFGFYLNFDMNGFAREQITAIEKYNHLLVELGEKSYSPDGSQWPVEVRLLGTILIQTGIFIVSRMVMKNFTSSSFNIPQPQEAPKRRMKEPEFTM